METDFDADDLAKSLYAFRSDVLFYLTDQTPLPDYLRVPLWEAAKRVQRAIVELEERHGCREAGLIYLGLARGTETPDGTPWWELPDDPQET
jgi:hypothetical protein